MIRVRFYVWIEEILFRTYVGRSSVCLICGNRFSDVWGWGYMWQLFAVFRSKSTLPVNFSCVTSAFREVTYV